MTKVAIKSEKLSPLGGIFHVREHFSHFVGPVILLLTALIRNFYKFIMARLDVKRFGLKATSRIEAFGFRFISVPAKWIKTSRQYVMNIYSCNNAYADVFQNDFR